jgi:hypothetical protein
LEEKGSAKVCDVNSLAKREIMGYLISTQNFKLLNKF